MNAVRSIFDDKPQGIDDIKVYHKLSDDERRKVKDQISLLDGNLVNELAGISNELKDIEITLDRIRSTEVRMDRDTDAVNEIFDRISKVSGDLAKAKARRSDLLSKNSELKRQITEVEKTITNWTKKAELLNQYKKQIDYCDRLRDTIKAFVKKFQAQRVKELEDSILKMWRRIARKKDIVKSVKVEVEKNFEILLYDRNDKLIDKTKISAGEKEIYAICLLSALVHVSGRQIPILIDTPYGRLDSKHRRNLAKSYFPNAGEQVFLLSQDEEVVGEFYKEIHPFVAKELTINYDQNTETSSITEGYLFANYKA